MKRFRRSYLVHTRCYFIWFWLVFIRTTSLDAHDHPRIAYIQDILSLPQISTADFYRLDTALFHINYYTSDIAHNLYVQAIKKALNQNEEIWAGRFEIRLADLLYELHLIDTGRYYADMAAERFLRLDQPVEYARTSNIRRILYSQQSNFTEAYKICFEALDTFRKYDEYIGKAIAFRDIGSIMILEEKYLEALKYISKSIEGLEKDDNWYELSFTYQRMGLVHKNLNNWDKAHYYINKSIDACSRLRSFRRPQGLSKKLWTKGNIYETQGIFDKAIEHYDLAKKYADSIGFYIYDKYYYNGKGSLYLKTEDYEGALLSYQKALEITIDQGSHQRAHDYYLPIYNNLMKAHAGLGQFEKAYALSQKIGAEKDSIFIIESDRQMAELQTKYETAEKEARISTLEKEKITQRNFILLGTFLLSMLGIGAFLLWKNNRYRAKVNNQLANQKDEIERKNHQNELLLKEIHHRVKNNLQTVSGLLSLQTAQIDDPNIKVAMNASKNRVQAMGLLHQKLYQGDNLGAIEMKDYFINLSEGVLHAFNANQQVRIDCEMEELSLDVDTAVPIGLIVNELLTNALKYAFPDNRKGHIKISLHSKDKGKLLLEVADNGIGADFDAPAQGTGFGSQLVQLLTTQLQGKLDRRIENGTVISLHLKYAA